MSYITNVKTMHDLSIGDEITYFNTAKRLTVTGIIKAFISDGNERAIIEHTGKFKGYFDVTIRLFAITKITL